MKAFDKWLKDTRRHPGIWTRIAYKVAWKAALWWVMKTAMNHYGNDFMTDMPMNKLYKSIEAELEDK